MSDLTFIKKLETQYNKSKCYFILNYYGQTELEQDIITYCNQHNYEYEIDYGQFWDEDLDMLQEQKYILVYLMGG
jgi:hypothetical protein